MTFARTRISTRPPIFTPTFSTSFVVTEHGTPHRCPLQSQMCDTRTHANIQAPSPPSLSPSPPHWLHRTWYGVATISRLIKIIGLFCRISSLLQGSFAKETYNFKEPTNRSHPPIWPYGCPPRVPTTAPSNLAH